MKKHLISLAALAAFAVTAPAHAQFGGLKNPLAGNSSGSGQTVDADAIKKSVSATMAALADANSRYAQALGNESLAAQFKEIATNLNNGSLGVDSKLIGTVKQLTESSVAAIKTKQESKEKVSADGKKLLVEGLGFHVKGTVAGFESSKKLKAALESKSPAVLAALASLKDFPGMFGQWTSATGNVLSYMTYNGIDTSKADKALSGAMKDDA